MPWQQLKIQTTFEHVENISTLLNLFGAKSITLLDAADQPIFEPAPGDNPIWQQDWIVGLFNGPINADQIIHFLRKKCGETAIVAYLLEPLAEQNWERAWLDNFKPMRFGRHLWICPSVYAPPEPDAINIILDPGLAFGTGTHPTTALCLEWLDSHPPQNLSVIDYGCGSGILGIAAVKLGAHEVWAVDYDEQALEATHANAARNHIIKANIHCLLPEQLPAIQSDCLLANILAAPLIALAPQFAQLVKPDGKIILSGILAEQAENVRQAYQNNFSLSLPQQKEEWILLEGTRIREIYNIKKS